MHGVELVLVHEENDQIADLKAIRTSATRVAKASGNASASRS